MTTSLRTSVIAALFIVSFSLVLPNNAFAACHVNDPAFSSGYRGDLNEDLNDYARILADADSNDRTCVEAASYALHDKVLATPLSSWSLWLQTGVAGVALAAANRIGANGFATKDLDNVLMPVTRSLAVGHDAARPCAKESLNQCVDDFSVAAPGFAWAAAYKFRRGDPDGDVATLRQQAIDAMQSAFDEVCIRKSDDISLCNGTVADLDANLAVTLSLNHDQQMPSYGFGLMTSIASTVLGLEASNYHYMFPPAQISIAKALAKEMQAHVSNNQFNSDCIDAAAKDEQGIWHISGAVFCGRLADQYQPGMYELKEFYDNYLGGMPAGSYQADTSSFNSSLFNLGANDGGFFSWGRYEVYFGQSYDWVVSPREYMPFDTYNPIGFFDQISASGLASGWTCDQDAPAHSNRVDFYSNGTFTAFGYATLPSEPAVNNLCGGGTAHRFQVQLPASARGTTIVAFGLDYTWYGFTQLPCSTTGSACTWPDNPPTASFTISCTGRSCTANASASSDDVGITGYQWSWGDNQTSSGGPLASHTFAANGTYTVMLTVTDTIGQANSTPRVVTVIDNPPVASFTLSCAGRSCAVNAGASSDDVGIVSYQWSWGDNQTSSGPTASHTYAVNGTYTITLTVTDTIGQTNSMPRVITVIDNPPVASFTISCTGHICTANASASSDDVGIAGYQWNWGDNQTSSGGPAASHTFAADGTYIVTLTVSDTIGQTGSTTRSAVAYTPAAIITQPTSNPGSIPSGGSSTLTIVVTGTAPVSVQWYTLAGNPVGSGPSISVSPTTTTVYYAIVSNAYATVQSLNVQVSICSPGLGTAPTATPSTIMTGQISRLELSNATGQGTLTYLWYKSDGTLVGTTTSKKLNVSPTVTTSYYYKVSNSCGTTGPSPTVTVTVQ
jgi:PKD repeat protein